VPVDHLLSIDWGVPAITCAAMLDWWKAEFQSAFGIGVVASWPSRRMLSVAHEADRQV
jgi:hypothetical protein